GIGCTDDRPKRPWFVGWSVRGYREQWQHPLGEFTHQWHSLSKRPGPHDCADYFEAFPEYGIEIHLRLGSLQEAEHHQAAPRRQHGKIIGESRTAQHVENHMDRLGDRSTEGSCSGINAAIQPVLA